MSVVEWSRRAEADFKRCTSYYDRIDLTLSGQIGRAIIEKTEWVAVTPHSGSPVGRDRRKVNVAGTPYLFVYERWSTGIRVIRLYHEKQNWDRR